MTRAFGPLYAQTTRLHTVQLLRITSIKKGLGDFRPDEAIDGGLLAGSGSSGSQCFQKYQRTLILAPFQASDWRLKFDREQPPYSRSIDRKEDFIQIEMSPL